MYMDLETEAILAAPILSSVPTRWERKQLQATTAASNSTTPISSSSVSTATTPHKSSKTPRSHKTPSSSSSSLSSSSSQSEYDRFIPSREGLSHAINRTIAFTNNNNNNNNNNNGDVDVALSSCSASTSANQPSSSCSFTSSSCNSSVCDENNAASASLFETHLASRLFNGDGVNSKILRYQPSAPKPQADHLNNLRVLYEANAQAAYKQKAATQRFIANQPERILDAPDIVDDYYLNLLDWSSSNVLAVGLGRIVYLWNGQTGSIEQLCETAGDEHSNNVVTSLNWSADGRHIAISTNTGCDVQVWDVEQKRKLRTMKGHSQRVAALAWNQHIISSGSRDSTIFQHDIRIAQHHLSTLSHHSGEVCGLKWNDEGTQLASGGNDNLCLIWDAATSVSGSGMNNIVNTPVAVFNESAAAVKAVAWCPWQRHTLATGSGTADRHIRIYNTATSSTAQLTSAVDTGSQVCSLAWSRTERELLSSHGFSQNQLCLWRFPQLTKLKELTGHTARVLHTSVSADGTTVCSAAADETLRFWKVWDLPKKPIMTGNHSAVAAACEVQTAKQIGACTEKTGATAPASHHRSMLSLNIR